MKPDLTYRKDGMFYTFYPETKQGERAWNEMAIVQGGAAKVLNWHLQDTLSQLKAAGYIVKLDNSPVRCIDDILDEMGDLLDDFNDKTESIVK